MMTEVLISLTLFLLSYVISVTFTSIFYHRALCHGALILNPVLKKLVVRYGLYLTAIDPAIWICTHRLHHIHSDQEQDPHAPQYFPSLLKMNKAHLDYYSLLNNELRDENSDYYQYIKDLKLSLHPLMKLPNIPFIKISWGNGIIYSLHLIIYVLIYMFTGSILYPLAIAAGLLGHPLQGVLVNYFGHIGERFSGYRNFDTKDMSCNNSLVALFIFGEGYQNNHHHSPSAIKFSVKKGEFDFGYLVCLFLRRLRLIEF